MKNDLQRAQVEMLMQRFRAAMAAGEAGAVLKEDRPAVTREAFEEMQTASPNTELHRVLPMKSVR